MNVQEMLDLVFQPLKSYAATIQGKAVIASDEINAWEYCATSSDFPKLVLVYTGEQVRGNMITGPIVRAYDFQFDCIVSRNRGLDANRVKSLIYGSGNALPLFKIVSAARDIIRCIESPALKEWPIAYRGTEQWTLPLPGWISDGYRIHYSILDFLPASSPELIAATLGNTAIPT